MSTNQMAVTMPVTCELWCVPAGATPKSDAVFPLSEEHFDQIVAARAGDLEAELKRANVVIQTLQKQIASQEAQIESMSRRAQLAAVGR